MRTTNTKKNDQNCRPSDERIMNLAHSLDVLLFLVHKRAECRSDRCCPTSKGFRNLFIADERGNRSWKLYCVSFLWVDWKHEEQKVMGITAKITISCAIVGSLCLGPDLAQIVPGPV